MGDAIPEPHSCSPALFLPVAGVKKPLVDKYAELNPPSRKSDGRSVIKLLHNFHLVSGEMPLSRLFPDFFFTWIIFITRLNIQPTQWHTLPGSGTGNVCRLQTRL